MKRKYKVGDVVYFPLGDYRQNIGVVLECLTLFDKREPGYTIRNIYTTWIYWKKESRLNPVTDPVELHNAKLTLSGNKI